MTSHRLLPMSRGRSTRGRRLLLITGTPGTGKRPLGSYLETQRGFLHIDLDNRESRTRFLRSGVDAQRHELATVTTTAAKIVVTWTFTAETQLAYVEEMRSLGFEWVWMDSDRGAAYDALVAESATEPPRFVDAFEPQGTFRALDSVIDELRRRRRIVPRRRQASVRGGWVPRPAWAGVVAFTAAGAALGATYLAGGFTPARQVRVSLAQSTPKGILPVNGVLVPGESLGGIRLGDTGGKVMELWGRDYTMISGQPMTWIYMSPTGDPYGAAVSFREGRVTAIFTLGGIEGWRRSDGLRVGQTLSTFNDPQGTTTACVGYGATSTRTGDAVTSILTNGQSIYGFALTRPNEPVCH
jgi:hypothetical protein